MIFNKKHVYSNKYMYIIILYKFENEANNIIKLIEGTEVKWNYYFESIFKIKSLLLLELQAILKKENNLTNFDFDIH